MDDLIEAINLSLPFIVKCPKEPKAILIDGTLDPDLAVKCCPGCGGAWIPSENHLVWQTQQGIDCEQEPHVEVLPSRADVSFEVSPLDNRAALCPNCGHYLVRGRVNLKDSMFFVERCPNCKGYWCDRGEWEILQQLKLDTHLENIFSDLWQNQVKELEAAERERSATVEKLGEAIANKIFELADLLEKHPNGDFGVAYLMRRFEE